jgi:hypothetical protein
MEFEYPQLIYLDTTSDTISLEQTDGARQVKYTMLDRGRGSSGVVYVNEDSTRCIKLMVYLPVEISDDDKAELTKNMKMKYDFKTFHTGLGLLQLFIKTSEQKLR